MKPVTFVAVNDKRRLPVAAAPRRNLLTVPVWDLLPTAVQRRCNTAFEFVSGALGPLDKKAVRQHAAIVDITKDVEIRFRLGLGASMRFVTGLLAAVLLLAGISASHAVVRIADDRGGRIGTYVDKYQGLRSSGETVIIDGLCASACTIVLGAVPHDRICVTSAANLGFHAAWDFGANGRAVTNTEATQMLYSMYPAPIKRWIAARGGLTPKMIFLRGKALQAIYKPCYLDAQASANRPSPASSRWEHDPAPQGRASVK
jgi:hypothetical protein